MKHIPAYFRNRNKLMSLSDDNVSLTETLVETWFDILNEQVFSLKLPNFGKIELVHDLDFHALFHYWPRRENLPTRLEINSTFESERLFVEILAHEMIHLFQYTYNEPLGHGPSFWLWRDNFTLKGLRLHKVA